MKVCFISVFKVVLFLAASVLIASLWWHLWLYNGLWGGFDLLRPFIWTDGESSYDRKYAEMWIQVSLLLGTGMVALAKLGHRRKLRYVQ